MGVQAVENYGNLLGHRFYQMDCASAIWKRVYTYMYNQPFV